MRAAKIAMEQAGSPPPDIDYVVFATMTPTTSSPARAASCRPSWGCATSGARHPPAVHRLHLRAAGRRRAAQGQGGQNLLLIGAESHSPFMPFHQLGSGAGQVEHKEISEEARPLAQIRDRAVLFSDAGAAIVLRREDETERGLIDFELHTDGANYNKLYVPSGMAHRPYVTEAMIQKLDHVPYMDGKFVFRMAVTKMPEVTRSLLAKHGYTINDVKMFIFHQANLRINEAVQRPWASRPSASTATSSATATPPPPPSPSPTTRCRRAGKIKSGDLCCFVGLGSGLPLGRGAAARLAHGRPPAGRDKRLFTQVRCRPARR